MYTIYRISPLYLDNIFPNRHHVQASPPACLTPFPPTVPNYVTSSSIHASYRPIQAFHSVGGGNILTSSLRISLFVCSASDSVNIV